MYSSSSAKLLFLEIDLLLLPLSELLARRHQPAANTHDLLNPSAPLLGRELMKRARILGELASQGGHSPPPFNLGARVLFVRRYEHEELHGAGANRLRELDHRPMVFRNHYPHPVCLHDRASYLF